MFNFSNFFNFCPNNPSEQAEVVEGKCLLGVSHIEGQNAIKRRTVHWHEIGTDVTKLLLFMVLLIFYTIF